MELRDFDAAGTGARMQCGSDGSCCHIDPQHKKMFKNGFNLKVLSNEN
jgi:hypothetical protein